MPWFSWPGRKKKSVDFNAFLVSKAKQQKEEADLEMQRRYAASQQQNQINSKVGENGQPSSQDHQDLQPKISSFFASSRTRPSRTTSFSLVLTDEDLKGLELQRKLEKLRQQGKEARKSQQQELEVVHQVLGNYKETLNEEWNKGIEWSEYLEVALRSMDEKTELPDDLLSPADDEGETAHENVVGDTTVRGSREADLMKVWHKVDMQDRLRKLLQTQTGDEIMRIYMMESTLKENFGEQEAKIVSQIVQMGVQLGKQREYNEERVEIYERIKARYEKAAKDHLDRVYRSLREQEDAREATVDITTMGGSGQNKEEPMKRPSMMAKSYSSRVLAADAEEKREQRIRRESSAQAAAEAAAANRVVESDEDEEEERAAHGDDVEIDQKLINERDATKNEDLGLSGHDTDSSEKENGDEVETKNGFPQRSVKVTTPAMRNGTTSPHFGIGAGRKTARSLPGSAAASRVTSSRSRLTQTTRASTANPTNTKPGGSPYAGGPAASRVTRSDMAATLRPVGRGAAPESLNSRRATNVATPTRSGGSTGRPTTATNIRLNRPGAPATSPPASNVASHRAVSTATTE